MKTVSDCSDTEEGGQNLNPMNTESLFSREAASSPTGPRSYSRGESRLSSAADDRNYTCKHTKRENGLDPPASWPDLLCHWSENVPDHLSARGGRQRHHPLGH
ncbi:hypothetical protein Q5P01_002795 [Channa striata]|uniref:Uncharacterized protein n=1 Tax=Channa striata TaxID=64152 RepID=A0AA88NR37_CHASR|nr:hypothetical protein Q5P01_002795 [Channa striata]